MGLRSLGPRALRLQSLPLSGGGEEATPGGSLFIPYEGVAFLEVGDLVVVVASRNP